MVKKSYVDWDMQGQRIRNIGGLATYNVQDYGMVSGVDGSTALQNLITAIPNEGGIIYFPYGNWLCASTISVEGRRNIIFRGAGGRSAGAQTTSLFYTNMTGSGRFISVRNSTGVRFENLEIAYTSASYTGNLIDATFLTNDANSISIDNCLITGLGVSTAVLLNLDKAITVSVTNTNFGGADICVKGKDGAASYSNRINFTNCDFMSSNTISIRNPGESWTFTSCNFGQGSQAAKSIDHDSGVLCEGLVIQGCWSGDTTGGTVFKVAGQGIHISGNYIGATSGTGINIDAASSGVVITGNRLEGCTTGIDISSSAAHNQVHIFGNSYNSVTTRISGAQNAATGSFIQDADSAGVMHGLVVKDVLQLNGVTTDPGSPVDGSLWHRSDTASIRARLDGTTVELPISPYIRWPTNDWHKVGQAGTVSVGTPTDAEMYLLPLWPGRKCSVARLAYEVTTQGVSGSGTDRMRFGIYSSSTTLGIPSGAPLIDFGDVDLEVTTGVKIFDVTDQALDPTLYWLAVVRQTTGTVGTAAQVRLQTGDSAQNMMVIKDTGGTPAIGAAGGSYGCYMQTGVTGALPSIGSLITSNAAIPIVLVEFA